LWWARSAFAGRDLWLLLGATFALFWVLALFLVADDLKLSF
jgi:hypothetical protein